MLKAEFVEEMQKRIDGSTKKQLNEFLDVFFESVADVLARGDEVKFVGFGTFKMRKIKAHEGINPYNPGEKINVKDVYTPMFKVGKGLKENALG